MDSLSAQPWFGWAVLTVIGLPIATIVLTELHTVLVRRRSALAGPIHLLRTYVLPVAALLVLLRQIPNDVVSNGGNLVRWVATIAGFLVLMFVLSTLNAALFLEASQGSWRQRMPSIFIDIVRVILIGTGLAFLFSWVWGTNVGGIFAALGVTTIVLGFALQNAVGSVISGLLLLFEQPFQLGDWLEFGAIKGRVVEVNWRSVHIDGGGGIQIVPNASLAGGTFTNLSRPGGHHLEPIETSFAEEDEPMRVIDLLSSVAGGLTLLPPGEEPSTVRSGKGTYVTSLPLATLVDAGPARAQFEVRVWYAARRAGLRLHGADIGEDVSKEDAMRLTRRFAPGLHLDEDRVEELADRVRVERYADGEHVMRTNQVPEHVRYIASGRVSMLVPGEHGPVSVLTLESGDSFGQTALTRNRTAFSALARGELTVLAVPRDVLDEIVGSTPALAREYGRQIEHLRQSAADALGIRLAELTRYLSR